MRKISTLIYFVSKVQSSLNKGYRERWESSHVGCEGGFEPSERSVQRILDFARSYETIETQTAGYVELVLN